MATAAPEKEKPVAPTVAPRKKYEMCKNWKEKGVCKYGEKCLFAHGDSELTKKSTPPTPPAALKTPISLNSDKFDKTREEKPDKGNNIALNTVNS